MIKIIRSAGLPTGYGFIAGGGFSGETAKLDRMVSQAAHMLRNKYRNDVTIRFNSDQKSGGAWVVTDPLDSIGGNTQIGICVTRFIARSGRDPNLKIRLDDFGGIPRALGENFIIHAHIGNASLRDKSIVTSENGNYPGDSDKCCCHKEVASLREAMQFIELHAVLRRSPRTKK